MADVAKSGGERLRMIDFPPPLDLLRPRRKIDAISAVLLPYQATGEVDWSGFVRLLHETIAAGLTPAVNMDTGYANLIDDPTRRRVLETARAEIGAGRLLAGAFVADQPGDVFDLGAYHRQIDLIAEFDAIPVVFQSYGLAHQADDAIVDSYAAIAATASQFVAFELGTAFAPFGRIYSLDVFHSLLTIPQCVGAKHSSLSRELEWRRLAIRDQSRPEFRIYTGNDLAIDMVMYGSDYLLGLSAFAPDAFAARDAAWENGDWSFYEWNDLLQYLGCFAFRPPTPAYKHSAAMFLKLREWIDGDATHPLSQCRPDSDRAVLSDIAQRIATRLGKVQMDGR